MGVFISEKHEKHVRNFEVSIGRKAVSSYKMEIYFFVHKDLKGSLARDFHGKPIHEKILKLKISCQTETPFKGL
jgi:hypothetical protein